MRVLALVTDAYGGRGGIARYNRDLLRGFCSFPEIREVVTLPRLVTDPPEQFPQGLIFVSTAAAGKRRFMAELSKLLITDRRFDYVICGHINLLPAAFMAAKCVGAPLLLVTYGIEAWQPAPSRIVNRLVRRVDGFISISAFTRDRFLEWARLDGANSYLVPPSVDLDAFSPGPKPAHLSERYGLRGRKVVLTVSRLVSGRYKGHDEILEVLSSVAARVPEVAYVVAGDGDDRPRLESKASALGLNNRVVFTGYIDEAEKADHYRLADVFAMPGWGEGFGIVYLEAAACGIPVIASSRDASQEPVRAAQLGIVVDPRNLSAVSCGLTEMLTGSRDGMLHRVDQYEFKHFERNLHQAIRTFP